MERKDENDEEVEEITPSLTFPSYRIENFMVEQTEVVVHLHRPKLNT